jgi:hypothetical protein
VGIDQRGDQEVAGECDDYGARGQWVLIDLGGGAGGEDFESAAGDIAAADAVGAGRDGVELDQE